MESSYRLDKWLTVDTSNGQWSMKGAEDAVEYYDLVNGDFDALKKDADATMLAGVAITVPVLRTFQPACTAYFL